MYLMQYTVKIYANLITKMKKRRLVENSKMKDLVEKEFEKQLLFKIEFKE